MADFGSLLRNVAIPLANSQTRSLQATVMLSHKIGESGSGAPVFMDPRPVHALVDWKQKQVRTQTGILSVSRAVITFLDIPELMAATNNEGLDDSDKIVLPSGDTGPILDMSGFIDPGTGNPFATEVYLG